MVKKLTLITALVSLTGFSAFSQQPTKFKHRPLLEEYTGFWCEWCPKGYIAMEIINEQYGDDQVTISFHHKDDLAVTSTFPVSFVGVPVATINRGKLLDPYYGTTEREDMQIATLLEEAMAEDAIAMVEVEAEFDGVNLNANAKAVFGDNFDDANYQIGYILVSDNLSNSRWRQSNEYYYYQDAEWIKGTPLEEVASWGFYVRGLVYNFVAIDAKGMMGIKNSLPSSIQAGETYEHSYSFNVASNPVVQNPDDIGVVAFIVDKNTGRTINSAKFMLNSKVEDPGTGDDETTSVDSVVDSEIVSSEYFDLTGKRILNPEKGIYIVKETLSDGTVNKRKIAKTL